MNINLSLLTPLALAAQLLAGAASARTSPDKQANPTAPAETITIQAPRTGAEFVAPASFAVEAVGIGRFGGITAVELVLDDQPVAESRLAFFRAPEADEPVQHLLQATGVGPAKHTLVVREIGNPRLASAPVTVVVLDPAIATNTTLRILTPPARRPGPARVQPRDRGRRHRPAGRNHPHGTVVGRRQGRRIPAVLHPAAGRR